MIADAAGNLCGTTEFGGGSGCQSPNQPSYGCGTVFKLTPSGTETVLYSFTGGSDGADPRGLIADASGNLYGTTYIGGGSGLGTVFKLVPSAAQWVAAVLPASRSVEVGATATAFATIINSGAATAPGCAIAPAAALPVTFHTNPSTNQVTDTPVTISAGAPRSFVVGLTANAAFGSTSLPFNFVCANVTPAPSHVGLNTCCCRPRLRRFPMSSPWPQPRRMTASCMSPVRQCRAPLR